MDEGSGDDDTRAKVLGNEEGPLRNANASVSGSVDGEPGS